MSPATGTGHYAEVGLMTGVHPDRIRPNDIRNGVSLDQEVASHLGGQTRFASLVVGGGVPRWNRRGVRIPAEQLDPPRSSANSSSAARPRKRPARCAESATG